jgi:hypothetical protein
VEVDNGQTALGSEAAKLLLLRFKACAGSSGLSDNLV